MKRDPSNSALVPRRPAKPLAAPVNHSTVRRHAHAKQGAGGLERVRGLRWTALITGTAWPGLTAWPAASPPRAPHRQPRKAAKARGRKVDEYAQGCGPCARGAKEEDSVGGA